MSWTLERRVTVGGVAAVLLIAVSGTTAWNDVKNKASAADAKATEIAQELDDHSAKHEDLNRSVQKLETGQAVVKEQVGDLKDDVEELKRNQQRGFDEVLRALGRSRGFSPPSDYDSNDE